MQAGAQTQADTRADTAKLEAQLGDLRYTSKVALVDSKIASLEQRLSDQDSAYARVEIILAAFGMLLTLVIVYLGWRVENSAIKAATQKAKDEIKASEAEINGCLTESKSVLGQVREILRDIEGHKAMSTQHLEQIEEMHLSIAKVNRKSR